MARPEKKKKTRNPLSEKDKRLMNKARNYLAKEIFPNFICMTLTALVDEINLGNTVDFKLDEDQKKQLLHEIADRIDHYCTLSNDGIINPWEMREAFEKTTGLDFSKMWIN